MRKLVAVLVFAGFLFATPAVPQQKNDDFLIYVVGLDTAAPIAAALKKKLSVSKPFAVAAKDDVSKAVVLICMDHEKEGLPYAYVRSEAEWRSVQDLHGWWIVLSDDTRHHG